MSGQPTAGLIGDSTGCIEANALQDLVSASRTGLSTIVPLTNSMLSKSPRPMFIAARKSEGRSMMTSLTAVAWILAYYVHPH